MIGKKKAMAVGMALLLVLGAAGCSKKTATTSGAVKVKAMQAIKRDTPITYEYTGFVEAKDEVSIKSKVTGTIVGKYVNGGDYVEAGQLLYEIDPRTYQADVLNAQANLANAQATLANAQRDAARYQTLYEQGAVSKQTADQYNTALAQAQASVDAYQALVTSSQVNVSDTRIIAPFAGKIDTNTLAAGEFVTANSTVLTTLSNSNPMRVRFSVSESDYLDMLKGNTDNGTQLRDITLTLADGSEYPYRGYVDQVDRSVSDTTGTLTLKAVFENPNNLLLPGMFANVSLVGSTVPNAVLVPQRAVTDLLYKHYVYVINSDNTVSLKEVQLGARIGRLWLVKSGLDGSETVVVEGVQKLNKDSKVDPTMITEDDLDTTESSSTSTDSTSAK
ncbi:MAG: efflux RND transporter periplasmic adaptor subunit [Acidaminococcus sp.]|jgi:membrane fusion protein (multidrug efflux system)|nr:efflux RND transporter periplasmic adaptor subunit [Acidaminococcus sp.]MCI2100536.1 efflux RND transporter periplasmic adaptor subunit [Acidaminococcus sp.]MCI2114857.1 efflux RND transporter periplasmic adaptor subunit [Acidaminococcus sp.]MCI2117345.1 efflux RND transporter periplasmic adaptor subunit [Acidaminococcus sp.]